MSSDMKNIGLRRAGAVIAGLLTTIIVTTVVDVILHSTGVFPPMGQPMSSTLWWLAIGYRVVITVLGGWVTAKLDPSEPMRAVAIGTGIGCVLGLVGVGIAMSKPEMGPAWYAWGVALTGPPACWWGGTLFVRSTSR